jgi:hypothetical protein
VTLYPLDHDTCSGYQTWACGFCGAKGEGDAVALREHFAKHGDAPTRDCREHTKTLAAALVRIHNISRAPRGLSSFDDIANIAVDALVEAGQGAQ